MRSSWFVLCSVVTIGCAEGGSDTVDARPGDAGTDVQGDIAEQDSGATGDTGAPDTGTADTVVVPDTSPLDTGAPDTGPLPCPAVDLEPNDTESSAVKLTDINDCDGSGGSFAGVVSGGSDVDVFRYRGSDTFGCVVDPTASTTEPVRLCIFVRCTSFLTKINSCPKGLPQTWGTTGIDGCCADSGGSVQVDYTCTDVGTSDTADVFLRIDQPGGTSCQNYSVKYHH